MRLKPEHVKRSGCASYVAPFGFPRYIPPMKLGYGYCRNDRDLRAAGAERVYLDGAKTQREDRKRLLADLRRGDIVVLLKRGDLGAGKGLIAIKAAIAAKGCTVEVHGEDDPPKRRGPPPQHEWRADVARLWHDQTVDPARPIALAKASRAQMNRVYGPRSKPRRSDF